jgi:hypothetical protein
MKKLFIFLVVASLFAISCKQEQKETKVEVDHLQKDNTINYIQKEQDSLFNDNDTIALDKSIFKNNKLLNAKLNALTLSEGNKLLFFNQSLFTCDSERHEYSERAHRLTNETHFETLASLHPENRGNTTIKLYSCTWKKLSDFMYNNQMSCYDGFLGFDLTSGAVEFKKFTYWSNGHTSYPPTLFEAIEKAYPTVSDIHFANALVVIKQDGHFNLCERLIFKIEYIDPADATKKSFSYYDMSDDPL